MPKQAKKVQARKRPTDAELAKILLKRALAPETSYATAPALLMAAAAIIIDLVKVHPPVEFRVIASLMAMSRDAHKRVASMVKSAGSA